MSAEGLNSLYRLVKMRCDMLLLEVNTGEGKSEVISPDDDLWELLDVNGNVELSLRQVVEYNYLGLETSASIYRTIMNKRRKCIRVANKYKFACLHLGTIGADVVDATMATWCNIALPSILFGCEGIIFNETTISDLESIQSDIAKSLLGLPSNTVNVCAQTELGMLPNSLILYKKQLNFYFRVLELPTSRWVKKALMEHLALTWPSPYLKYVTSVRNKVMLFSFPPTRKYLNVHLRS